MSWLWKGLIIISALLLTRCNPSVEIECKPNTEAKVEVSHDETIVDNKLDYKGSPKLIFDANGDVIGSPRSSEVVE